jgi:hypothetical protein
LSGSTILRRAVCAAGASPNSNTVNTAAPRLKSSTGTFNRTTTSRGISPSGMSGVTPLIPIQAKKIPRAAPPSASNELSISSWRMRRPRPAPSDARTAISRLRAAALASSMIATLKQPIRRSNPTAAAIVYSVVLNDPTRLSTQLTTMTSNCFG